MGSVGVEFLYCDKDIGGCSDKAWWWYTHSQILLVLLFIFSLRIHTYLVAK